MKLPSFTGTRLRQAELLSGVALSKEIRKRIHAVTPQLSRAPCLAVVLVGDRADSARYVNHKKRAAVECGIEMRVVHLPGTIRQAELHRALAAVNGDVAVDGVILQLPLPPHLRARPALFHIHPGKDVDGLHPLNAGNLFLQDQSPLINALTRSKLTEAADCVAAASSADTTTVPDRLAHGLTDEVMLLATYSGRYSALRRRTHESKFFVPCTALAIRSILFSYLSRSESLADLMAAVHEESELTKPSASSSSSMAGIGDTVSGTHRTATTQTRPQRDLHAVIVNKSMVVGVPTAALLQRAGGFVVTLCSRSNSIEAVRCLARQADVLITAYGQANLFDASCVKEGAIIIDAAINELPQCSASATSKSDVSITDNSNMDCAAETTAATAAEGKKRVLCGDVDVASVCTVAAAVTKTPGGVGPLTVSHLMMNVLKAYRLRHANHLYYNNIYTEFLKMYGTYDKVRDYAPSVALVVASPVAAMPVDAAILSKSNHPASTSPDADEDDGCGGGSENVDDDDADNESYEV
jgi:5,10-methylene-tetrahydrofolate dehydrogenase/methenyl tetrahydrofolate cyclohydrolase